MLKKEITLRWKVPFPTEHPGEILTDSMFGSFCSFSCGRSVARSSPNGAELSHSVT